MRLVVRTLPTVCFRECRALRESQGVKRGEDAAGRQKDWSSGVCCLEGWGCIVEAASTCVSAASQDGEGCGDEGRIVTDMRDLA